MLTNKKFKTLQEEIDWWASLTLEEKQKIISKDIEKKVKKKVKNIMKDFKENFNSDKIF